MGGDSSILTQAQASLLTVVANSIVPPQDRLPGAGDLGAARHIGSIIEDSPQLRRLFLSGLAHIEIAASRALGKAFGDLTVDEKERVLTQVEREMPDFFKALVQHTYNSYYTNPSIFPLIEYEGHAAQLRSPEMVPLDASLLDNVRKRGPTYRGT